MIEIIPAIIAKSFKALKEKIGKVEPYVKWVHLDIMDGKFVPNETWNNPEDLASEKFAVSLEAHLMINEPEKYVEKWIDSGIKRIIFHIEATSDPCRLIQLCREKKVEVGVALNPETSQSAINNVTELARLAANGSELCGVDTVLILGVTPGFSGQEFKPEVLSKIRALRKNYPHLTIGVDGGMNEKTAKQVVEAGADVIVAGSYIFSSEDIKKAIDKLKAYGLCQLQAIKQ